MAKKPSHRRRNFGASFTKRNVARWLLDHRRISADGCWEWVPYDGREERHGPSGRRRRPKTRINGRRYYVSHLAAWVWLGFDPVYHPGLQINHHCDNWRCFNPHGGHIYVGTQVQNIEDMWKRRRWTSKHPRRGELSSTAKITQGDVEEILDLRAHGWKLREIGEEYQLSVPQVSRICNGRRWEWLTNR